MGAGVIAERVKQPLPILSFPCVQLQDVSVRELVASSELQAAGMQAVADRVKAAATVSMMDLSVEAEAFGSQIVFSQDEVPTVVGAIVSDQEEADALVMGNVSPARQFRGGTPESIRESTLQIMEACCGNANFVISSGCDIPPQSAWENIDSFFAAAVEFYQGK